MGIISSSMNGESPDFENDPKGKEEEYEKLYMKIGRDFVHRDDLALILDSLVIRLSELNPQIAISFSDNPIDYSVDSGAMEKAQIYKQILDTGEDGSKRFKDLIDLSE
tara:strand:+ start:1066 stop:1389 length:324 start_codon:yes stop_codon:yes gene_type:complete